MIKEAADTLKSLTREATFAGNHNLQYIFKGFKSTKVKGPVSIVFSKIIECYPKQ